MYCWWWQLNVSWQNILFYDRLWGKCFVLPPCAIIFPYLVWIFVISSSFIHSCDVQINLKRWLVRNLWSSTTIFLLPKFFLTCDIGLVTALHYSMLQESRLLFDKFVLWLGGWGGVEGGNRFWHIFRVAANSEHAIFTLQFIGVIMGTKRTWAPLKLAY